MQTYRSEPQSQYERFAAATGFSDEDEIGDFGGYDEDGDYVFHRRRMELDDDDDVDMDMDADGNEDEEEEEDEEKNAHNNSSDPEADQSANGSKAAEYGPHISERAKRALNRSSQTSSMQLMFD